MLPVLLVWDFKTLQAGSKKVFKLFVWLHKLSMWAIIFFTMEASYSVDGGCGYAKVCEQLMAYLVSAALLCQVFPTASTWEKTPI